ncbi:MAG: hypothetical protein PHI05_00860 [Bacilli bacterium]|nr:hypothetical protein [Bacilli bacterium]MDD4547291.1 hypothetical protein [Bacilli bacterium]
MERINLINANNEPFNAEVIRYFELNNSGYLIYSLNEVDEQNYVKLYAVKVNNENGALITTNIDEDAWTAIKELIKVIIRANKDGVAEVADLNLANLESLKINDGRVFKLSNQLTELLGANKKVVVEQPVVEETPAMPEVEETPVVTPEQNMDNEWPMEPSIDAVTETAELTPVETTTPEVASEVSLENEWPMEPTVETTDEKVAVDSFKELYEQEKLKNEELINKLNEIKKLIG